MILFTVALLLATSFFGQSKKELSLRIDSLKQELSSTTDNLKKCSGDVTSLQTEKDDLENQLRQCTADLAECKKNPTVATPAQSGSNGSTKDKKDSAKTATDTKTKADKKEEKKTSSSPKAKPEKKSETATGFKTKAELIKFLENGGHGKEYMDMLRYVYGEDSDSSLVSWLKKLDTTQVFGPMQTARSTYTGIPEPRWLATDVDNQKVIDGGEYEVHIIVSDGSLVRYVPVVDATDYSKIAQMIADEVSPIQSSVDSLSGDVSGLNEKLDDINTGVKKLDGCNNTILYIILGVGIACLLLLIFAQWYSLRKARREEYRIEEN